MNLYSLLRAMSGGLPRPLKMAGLWAMYMARRRLACVFLDPVLSCNLRCRMCYFSGPHSRPRPMPPMDGDCLQMVERALFGRALRLQIGCGAEPTLYAGLVGLVRRARAAGIPHIAIATNGQLIASGHVDLDALVSAGLDEIILSIHGTDRATYEHLMPGADFALLSALIDRLRELKKHRPEFMVRVNFTVNSLNISNLSDGSFWTLLGEGFVPDVVQLRPVQRLGDTDWADFDPQPLIDAYDSSFGRMAVECRERGVTCIVPSRDQIAAAAMPDAISALVDDVTRCYVSPEICYKPDFRVDDTYDTYNRRAHVATRLFRAIFRAPRNLPANPGSNDSAGSSAPGNEFHYNVR